MSKHFHFDLGNMPPIGWAVLIIVIAMLAGKLFLLDWLFKLGAVGFGVIVVIVIIALIQEAFN